MNGLRTILTFVLLLTVAAAPAQRTEMASEPIPSKCGNRSLRKKNRSPLPDMSTWITAIISVLTVWYIVR